MKYMVIVPDMPPEYVEADAFRVDDGHTLHLFTGTRESASFVGWLGIKEVAAPGSVVVTSTNTNPARVKIKGFVRTARGSEEITIGE